MWRHVCCTMRSFFRRIRSAAYSVLPALAFLIASRCANIAARSSTNRARCLASSALYGVAGNFARIASNSLRVRSTSIYAAACSQGMCGLDSDGLNS